MSDRTPGIHGVLVTYQRPVELAETLEAVGRQSRRLDTLVVVDNSPTDEIKAVVAAATAAARIDYVANDHNAGAAGGIALGMQRCLAHAADDDWIFLLDDDDPPPDDDVIADHLRVAITAAPKVAGIGAGGAWLDWKRGRLNPVHSGSADYLKSGWFPLYRVSAVRVVGVFHAPLFFGFDDLEYGLRLRASGWHLLVVPGRSASRANGSKPSLRVGPVEWRRYYSLRNLIHLLRTHGRSGVAARVALISGLAKPLLNLPLSPRSASRQFALNGRAIHDGWTGRLGLRVAPDGGRRAGK